MPKSRIRRKANYTPPTKAVPLSQRVSGRWVAPLMVTFFLIGLAWIVTFYIAGTVIPGTDLQNWNIVIGFVLLGAGFVTATRWK